MEAGSYPGGTETSQRLELGDHVNWYAVFRCCTNYLVGRKGDGKYIEALIRSLEVDCSE